MIDYLVYIIVRFISNIFILLPIEFSLFLGRLSGVIFYHLDSRRRSTVYKNLRIAFSQTHSPNKLKAIAKGLYKHYGQNIIEALIVPKIDKDYMNRYIEVEGLNYINESIKKGKGLILLSVHFGSWEVSHVTCSLLGYPFKILIKEQKHFKRLAELLELHRRDKGCIAIQTGMPTREIIRSLKNNEMIGMVADQSGKDGVLVPFLNRTASLPVGAIRFALRLGSPIVPAFIIRKRGPYHRIVLEKPINIEPTDSYDADIYNNLIKIKTLLEKYIQRYPEQYCWFYKVWKYSDERRLLVLSDKKTGHIRQMEAVLSIIKESRYKIKQDVVNVEFKNRLSKVMLNMLFLFKRSKYSQVNFRYLKWFLKKDSYEKLASLYADIVISCGWSLSAVNLILSRENRARSVSIMKPAIFSTRRFDLAIIPQHDNPPKRENVVITEGALNLIDEEYLKRSSEILASRIKIQDERLNIGIFIGGNSKGFFLKREPIEELIKEIKIISEQLGVGLLITTSRRTPGDVEELIKSQFRDYHATKLLIIANEQNIPQAVGGILGLSKIIIVSPDTISMVSEAASSSGRYVIVFDIEDRKNKLPKKQRRFLLGLSKKGYINFVDYKNIKDSVIKIWQEKPSIKILRDKELIKEPLLKLF